MYAPEISVDKAMTAAADSRHINGLSTPISKINSKAMVDSHSHHINLVIGALCNSQYVIVMSVTSLIKLKKFLVFSSFQASKTNVSNVN